MALEYDISIERVELVGWLWEGAFLGRTNKTTPTDKMKKSEIGRSDHWVSVCTYLVTVGGGILGLHR